MGRREFITLLGGTVVTWPLLGLAQHAQETGKVYQIGYLSAPTRQSVQHLLDAFLRKLRELGWVEGKNINIDYRWAEGNLGILPDLATNLVRRNVDLIIAPTSSAAIAAKNATSRIPIVTIFPRDPVELGLVTSRVTQGEMSLGRPSRQVRDGVASF